MLLAGALAACTAVKSPMGAAATAAIDGQPTVVSLTFDDGDADNFAVAPVLEQYGLKATWYIPSGLVGQPGYMTWDQLRQLAGSGHEIGGHSLDHINVGDLHGAELKHQVCDDRGNLIAHGFMPLSFAYPYGGYSDEASHAVQDCGYLDARTIAAGPESLPAADPYALRAFPYVVADTNFPKLQRYVAGARQAGGGWVILIFHHVCDGCDYFAVKPDVLTRFLRWLGQEEGLGRLQVKTISVVMEGGVTP
jgi:peptidoglycan/xylan/chitin deacetylase (PgdA/CDA1 family)